MELNTPRKRLNRTVMDICIALLVAAYATLFMTVWDAIDEIEYVDGALTVYYGFSFLRISVFSFGTFLFAFMLMRACRRSSARLSDGLYKWRYLTGAVFIAAMVILKISGSSIHCWSDVIQSDVNGVLLGKARAIRTDEWAVNTSFAFAQAASGFKYHSPVIGGGMDAFIVYGQPVLDIGVLFRPFQWGYLFLGPERGLSFFWSARLVALILVSFDLGMLILKNKRGLAAMFSLMIAFAPFVQWWFAINGMVEMLVFGFSAILILNRYLQTHSYPRRAAYGAIIAWLGTSYILTFYPAWLVPISYIMLVLVIWSFLQNRKVMALTGKDALVLLEMLAIMAVSLGYVFFKSRDTIGLVMNTVYPGKRVGINTIPIQDLFIYPSGLFTTFLGQFPGSNACEVAGFFSFFPLGLVLFVINVVRRRRMDSLSLGLVVSSVFLGLYCFAGFPELLLNITMLRFSMAGRTLPILMMGQLMLLFREMAVAEDSVPLRYSLPLAVIISVLTVYAANNRLNGYYLPVMTAILFVGFLGVSLSVLLIGKYPKMSLTLWVCVVTVALYGGLLVNPVQVGAGEILDNEVARLVKPIVEDAPDACWIVDDEYPFINAIIPVGARTINSTNVYPQMTLWRKLDKDGEYEDIYNRYAHITVQLIPEDTRFEYGETPDQFTLLLNPDDLPLLDVDYILSKRQLEALDTGGIHFENIATSGIYKVYRVCYNQPEDIS